MKKFLSGVVLTVTLCGLYATAQQPHVTTTLPSATVKLNGASGGGGSGTGFTYDAGDLQWLFEPPSGADRVMIRTDSMNFNDAADETLMQILPAAAASGSGVTTYYAGRLAAAAIEQRAVNTLSATGTIVGANVLCSTGAGAVVGTLDASAANVGQFVYVTRDGANTCTVGVESGHTLDGVTDGTTTVPSAGWKTFVQTTSTAWVTAGSYPVTGTLSGLTATKLPVATSATAVGDSAITHVAATGVTTFGGSGPKLVLGTDALFKFNAGDGTLDLRNAADSAYVNFRSAAIVAQIDAVDYYIVLGDSVALYDDTWDPLFGMRMKNGAVMSWPNSGTASQAIGYTGLQISQSKALVDATATAFSRVAVASNSYEGGVLHYTIFATDATDYQNRSGSVPFAIRNLGGTETCTFGTASDAYDGTGTLTVTFDCAAGTDTVDLRATADTSLASTTIFTIQARVDLTSGLATVTPQ